MSAPTTESAGSGGLHDDPFVRHRGLLFTVAYQMLGSAADADDVVQETWLRWANVDRSAVSDPRAYLVRTATRQALNRLRTLARRREDYVGEWLPEPLLTTPDVAEDVELAEHVSMAMLTVLETLGPTERAVFVLREVFDAPYEEIADVLEKSPAAVRQIARRARVHVAARRPRVPVSRTEQQIAVARFRTAIQTGDVRALLDVLAPDVLLVADGGGIVQAFPHPLRGARRTARVFAQFPAFVPGAHIWSVSVNGAAALRVDIDGGLEATVSLSVADGRITHIYIVRNPQKLTHLRQAVPLRRS
ncbi:RNA polymerase sigma-70 factor [Nocardia brasiliensis]|uniref:RNA polymerase sigma-70 factor n=1 Tax=Nocardia brasiliensis TaxID=37326 RepID=A0A6G9XRM2_NOCBR|nr:RNA polymerase sigma-70 factor [Nocardia brasiliensis]QIS03473.1 RNA polymerase sigma-70 factor [Nocardia brasiliensis]